MHRFTLRDLWTTPKQRRETYDKLLTVLVRKNIQAQREDKESVGGREGKDGSWWEIEWAENDGSRSERKEQQSQWERDLLLNMGLNVRGTPFNPTIKCIHEINKKVGIQILYLTFCFLFYIPPTVVEYKKWDKWIVLKN